MQKNTRPVHSLYEKYMHISIIIQMIIKGEENRFLPQSREQRQQLEDRDSFKEQCGGGGARGRRRGGDGRGNNCGRSRKLVGGAGLGCFHHLLG